MIAEHEDGADRAHTGSSLKTGYIAVLYETSSSSPICEEGRRRVRVATVGIECHRPEQRRLADKKRRPRTKRLRGNELRNEED